LVDFSSKGNADTGSGGIYIKNAQGKLADFVILEQNPRRTDPLKIRHIKVKETWIDGKPVSIQ